VRNFCSPPSHRRLTALCSAGATALRSWRCRPYVTRSSTSCRPIGTGPPSLHIAGGSTPLALLGLTPRAASPRRVGRRGLRVAAAHSCRCERAASKQSPGDSVRKLVTLGIASALAPPMAGWLLSLAGHVDHSCVAVVTVSPACVGLEAPRYMQLADEGRAKPWRPQAYAAVGQCWSPD